MSLSHSSSKLQTQSESAIFNPTCRTQHKSIKTNQTNKKKSCNSGGQMRRLRRTDRQTEDLWPTCWVGALRCRSILLQVSTQQKCLWMRAQSFHIPHRDRARRQNTLMQPSMCIAALVFVFMNVMPDTFTSVKSRWQDLRVHTGSDTQLHCEDYTVQLIEKWHYHIEFNSDYLIGWRRRFRLNLF